MEFTIEKPKKGKGFSYPLKTSMLKAAVDDAKIVTTIHLIYWTPQKYDATYNILECEFWPANKSIDYDRFYIRAGVVKSQDRKIVEDFLKADIIPRLVSFMKDKLKLPDNSTKLKQNSYFKAVFADNKFLINP